MAKDQLEAMMTLLDRTTARPARAAAPAMPLWSKVDAGFWACNDAGTFIGTIERTASDIYIARDALSNPVGEHKTLADAMEAVTSRVA